MTAYLLNPLVFPIRAGLLLAAAVVIVSAPSRSYAGCGDHATVLKQAGGPTNLSPSNFPPTPCRGPGCSAQPSKPLIPPVPAPVSNHSTVKDAVSMVESGHDDASVVNRFSIIEPLLELDRIASSIFHPPRA